MLVPRRLRCRPLSFTRVAPTCPPAPPVLGHGATKSSTDTRLHWGVWIYQIHCDEQHVHFHTNPLGIQVFFRLHHYLDKRSLSVTKCVSGGERGEAVGSALVPLINAFLSVYELQFGPRKCIGDSKLVQKMRQCFHFCQKKLISLVGNHWVCVFTIPEQNSGVWWSLSLVFHSIPRKQAG